MAYESGRVSEGDSRRISDPLTHTVIVKSSAQVGKSEILLNTIAFFAASDPSSMLVLQPTLEMALTFSKDRLAPMIRDTPMLRELVVADDRQDTLLHKQFPGGRLAIAGANSPAVLQVVLLRIVLLDEVDRYPASLVPREILLRLRRRGQRLFGTARSC